MARVKGTAKENAKLKSLKTHATLAVAEGGFIPNLHTHKLLRCI
jgi:hypothetical protein